MSSLVHEHRKELEALGEYVTRANVGWFALFPKTLKLREGVGKACGRADVNLIVYRTKSGELRDHHVIRMALVKQLLSDATLSDSITGEKRWNMVLAGDTGRLKVTHGEHDLDVSRFRGVPLITEFSPPTNFDPARAGNAPCLQGSGEHSASVQEAMKSGLNLGLKPEIFA